MAAPIASLLLHLLSLPLLALSKSTIEPCSVSDSCNALVGYTLYTDLKVSEVAALFQADPISLLTANSIDISIPDVENRILPANLFLKIPTICSCADGLRKSISTRYKTRPSDTLASIADSIYAGLASADQIREANTIADPSALEAGQTLVIPLPCTCFNSSDNFLPAIYLSYVVLPGDTVPGIAARYSTTVTDIVNANAMGSPVVKAGDILAIPLPACASNFPRYASDYGLVVANGTYAITSSHCVQCSCGPGNLNLYCTPASLAVSCSSMQCRGSNLMLGNVTAQPTSAGCNVTSCTYGGFANGTILTMATPISFCGASANFCEPRVVLGSIAVAGTIASRWCRTCTKECSSRTFHLTWCFCKWTCWKHFKGSSSKAIESFGRWHSFLAAAEISVVNVLSFLVLLCCALNI